MTSIGVLGMVLYGLLGLTSSATVERGGTVAEGRGKLVFTHILFRHGDRSPTAFYVTDPYSSPKDWPVGLGELSNTGKAQHYKLGQWLRGRYDEQFLPKRYSEKHIYVRSTDYDRTIDSASCNLAGLFPPTGDQFWNKAIRWQPIPVHNVPAEYDWLLGAYLPACPAYEQALAKVYASSNVQNVFQEYRSEIDFALASAGENLNVSSSDLVMAVLTIRDALFIESLYKKKLPEWTKSIFPSDWLDEVSLLYYTVPAYTPQLAKFRTGFFFKDILDRSTSKVNGTLSPDISAYVYSAHDINISTVLVGLGMWDNQFVQYAAALLFEVRVHENEPHMQIFYKRTVESVTPELLFIPDCGYTCPLSRLYELYDNILPKKDFNTECKLKT